MSRVVSYAKFCAISGMTLLAIHVCAAPAYAQDETAWEFFRDNVGRADSISKWIALLFFTAVQFWLDMASFPWLAPIALTAVSILAAAMPCVRRSRLVQFGFVCLVLGCAPLILAVVLGEDNAIGPGFLFAFAMPVGLLTTVTGTAIAILIARVRRRE